MRYNIFEEVEEMENIKYKKNFLNNVILQFQVSEKSSVNLINDKFLKTILKYFSSILPDVEERQTNLDLNSNLPQTSCVCSVRKQYVSSNRNYKITFNQNMITIEVMKYVSFDELLGNSKAIIDKLFELYPEILIQRIGLRYIDVFNELKAMNTFFQNGLQSYIKRFDKSMFDDVSLARAISREEYILKDFRCILQYGYFNQFYPAELTNKQFVIDTDVIFQGVIQKDTDLYEKLKSMRDVALRVFENCITDKMRNFLNE